MKGFVAFIGFVSVIMIGYIIISFDNKSTEFEKKKERIKKDESTHYYNEKFIIREKQYVGCQTQYVLLIQRIENPQKYTELNSYNWEPLKAVHGSSIFYSYDVNDTIYFDHILKSRFWEMKK